MVTSVDTCIDLPLYHITEFVNCSYTGYTLHEQDSGVQGTISALRTPLIRCTEDSQIIAIYHRWRGRKVAQVAKSLFWASVLLRQCNFDHIVYYKYIQLFVGENPHFIGKCKWFMEDWTKDICQSWDKTFVTHETLITITRPKKFRVGRNGLQNLAKQDPGGAGQSR